MMNLPITARISRPCWAALLLLVNLLQPSSPLWAKSGGLLGIVSSTAEAKKAKGIKKVQYKKAIIEKFQSAVTYIVDDPSKRQKLFLLCFIANETPVHIFSSEELATAFHQRFGESTEKDPQVIQKYLESMGIKSRTSRRSSYLKVRRNYPQISAQNKVLSEQLTLLQLPVTSQLSLDNLRTPEAQLWQRKLAEFGAVADKIARFKLILGRKYKTTKKWPQRLALLETLTYMILYHEGYSPKLIKGMKLKPRTVYRNLLDMELIANPDDAKTLEEILNNPAERMELQWRIRKFLDKATEDATVRSYVGEWFRELKKKEKSKKK